MSSPVYLTVHQVAERYGVSIDSIWRWKREGRFPKAVKLGPSCTRWRLADLEEHERSLPVGFAATLREPPLFGRA